MKLVLPTIQIQEDAGFEGEIDIFKRSEFGERLANLIQNTDDNPVFALDAAWGEGKSTFIKMWRGYLEHHRDVPLKTIYFDAFENDFQKDPFLTLAAEIYSLLEDKDEENKKKFTEKATSAAKSLMRGAIKIGVRTVTAGVIDGTAIDEAEKEISNLIANQVDDVISDKFKNIQKDKLALNNFKAYLETLSDEISPDNPIVFIIDELDRCRPDFALELLEQVKHLFSVKGITFLLITNRTQLEQSIKTKYGNEIDPTNYLHKFINLWLTLPKKSDEYYDSNSEFIKYALSQMLVGDEKINNEQCTRTFMDIVKYFPISFREIERMLSYFSILHNMAGEASYYSNYQYMMAFVCYIRAVKPNLLNNINEKSIDEILSESGLTDVEETNCFFTIFYIKNLIIYGFSSEEKKRQMLQDKTVHSDDFGRMPPNLLLNIASWFSEIKI